MQLTTQSELIIIGGGLAGSEAAWQAASRGIKVRIYEMRPVVKTGAHKSANLAELVCSNSLGSNLPDRAAGIIKQELRSLGSLLMTCADQCAVPGGGALAVDRDAFSQEVTNKLHSHPLIDIIHEEVVEVPNVTTIIATGPLTSPSFSNAIQKLTGHEQIFFFDALAPIVIYNSINQDIAFFASRYGNQSGDSSGDYLNCPLSKDEYYHFVDELISAQRRPLNEFDKEIISGVRAGIDKYFEGCLPIEIIAARGKDSLAYGPLRPVGITDKRTGSHSFAVVQLRQDNLAKTLFNMVGFQTNLKYAEQERVFRMIPGLEKVEFERYGQMHRNTFIFSPGLLFPTLQYKQRENLFFAGQITGVEGYMGNIATGWLAGINAAHYLHGEPLVEMPTSILIGALCHYITHADAKDFQPMKANFGLLEELDIKIKDKRMRAKAYAERSARAVEHYTETISIKS